MAGYNSNNLLSINSASIEEVLGTAVLLEMKEKDDVFRELILDPATELAQAEIGRDLLVDRQYKIRGMSGVVDGLPKGSYNSLEGTTANNFPGGRAWRTNISGGPNSALIGWPSPFPAANFTPFNQKMRVSGIRLNQVISINEMRLDNMKAAKFHDLVETRILGVAKLAAQWMRTMFWADRAQSNRLGTMGTSAGTGATNNPQITSASKRITFAPTEGTIKRFQVGMPVDIYLGTSSPYNARLNEDANGARVNVLVVAVDPWNRTVTLEADPSDLTEEGASTYVFANWATNAALSGSFVTWANQPNRTSGNQTDTSKRIRGIAGWRDWIKWGATTATEDTTLLGDPASSNSFGVSGYGIDVTTHKEFKSGYFASVGTLTAFKLMGMLDRIEQAMDPLGYSIDDLNATDGVWPQYMSQFESRLQFNSPLNKPQVSGIFGDNEPGIVSSSGRRYGFKTVPDLESGLILGLKTKGNWELIVPPEPTSGAFSLPRGNTSPKLPIRLLTPALTGGAMTWFPVLINNGLSMTEFAQLPGWMHCQIRPKVQVPGVLMDGVSQYRAAAF